MLEIHTTPDLHTDPNATLNGPGLRHMIGQALPSPENGARERNTRRTANHVATRQAPLRLLGVVVEDLRECATVQPLCGLLELSQAPKRWPF